MPPRKRAAGPDEPPPPIPTDQEIGDAIRELRAADNANHDAYAAYTEARKKVVRLLTAAGVLGFVGLERL
jgi:hypothetical protein